MDKLRDLLSCLLSVCPRLHAGVLPVVSAVGVLPVRVLDLLVLLLRLLQAVPRRGGGGAAAAQRLRADRASQTIKVYILLSTTPCIFRYTLTVERLDLLNAPNWLRLIKQQPTRIKADLIPTRAEHSAARAAPPARHVTEGYCNRTKYAVK